MIFFIFRSVSEMVENCCTMNKTLISATTTITIKLCLSLAWLSSQIWVSNSLEYRASILPAILKSNYCSGRLRNCRALFSSSASTSFVEPPAIIIDQVTCSHDGGETFQLQDVTYSLPRSKKVALIGRNGAGKSTLLRILAEATCLDNYQHLATADLGMKYSGKVTSSSRSIRVSYVEQEPPLYADVTVADALLGIRGTTLNNNYDKVTSSVANYSNKITTNNVFAVVRWYKHAVANAHSDPSAFARASADMDRMDGWSVLTKAEEIATKLRVQHLQDRFLSNLSGGERKRVALGAALVQEPDVLLLDEPTNYLSLAGVQWLADLLKSNKKLTILMVTHDRAFLDDVCDRMLELDRGRLYEYTGSYMDFLVAKEERLALEDAAVQNAKTKYKVELEWMRRQPQARQTKSKARIDAFYKLQKSTKPRPTDLMLSLQSTNQRIGGKIFTIKNASLSFGTKVILNDFSYEFCMGDRICISGGNGVGKTSFIKVLTGEILPDSGHVEAGETIKLGVYDQMGVTVENPEQTVLDFVLQQVQANSQHSSASDASVDARRLLNRFEFPRQRWNERISVLSGGERRRLQLLTVVTKNPNFLILDECTSDLDHQTVMAIESYLLDFKGVLLIISHDRFFADKVTDHLFIFEGNGSVIDYPGTLSEYASTLIDQENENIANEIPINRASEESGTKKDYYKDSKAKRNEQQNTIRQLRKEIEYLEISVEKLKLKAADKQKEIDESNNSGWSVLASLTGELSKINATIDEKEQRWMVLAEQLEDIQAQV